MRGDQLGVVHHEHTTATCKHVLNRPSPDAASLFFQHMHLLKRHITHTKWMIPGTKNSSTLARRTQSWPHREYDRPWTARVRGGPSGTDHYCRPFSCTCCQKRPNVCCAIHKIGDVPQVLPQKHTTPIWPSKHSVPGVCQNGAGTAQTPFKARTTDMQTGPTCPWPS